MRATGVGSLLLLGWLAGSSVGAQPAAPLLFAAPQTTTGVLPRGVEVADLDGNGFADVVVAAEQSSSLDVLLGDGTGRLRPGPRPPTARGPRAVAVADFDGDGHLDVAVGHCLAEEVWVLLGDGTGRLAGAPERAATAGGCVQDLVAVDVTGDTVPDLVVATVSGVRILVSDGVGGLLPTATQTLVDARFGLATGDLDDDGDLDVVAAGPADVRALLNSGAGLEQGTLIPTSGSGLHVALGDVDGDGVLDVATADAGRGTVTIARGLGGGRFSRPDAVTLRVSVVRVQMADLDGDGRAEVLSLVQPTSAQPGELAIVTRERGSGRFVVRTQEVGRTALGLRIARIDRDRAPDVVITTGLSCATGGCAGPGEVTVLLNRGLNGLGAYRLSPVGPGEPRALAAGDLDGDGVLDLAVALVRPDAVGVLRNDGFGSFRRTTIADGLVFPTAVAMGDVDGDGAVDVVVGDVDSIWISRNAGDGSLRPVDRVGSTFRPHQAALADLDADGDLDIVIVDRFGLQVLRNEGGGTFPAPSDAYPVAELTERFTIGDINGDGAPDVVTADPLGERFAVYLNDGSGRLGTPGFQKLPEGRPVALAAGDLDGDGDADLVVAVAGAPRPVHVLTSDGGGFSVTASLPGSETITSLLLGDIDLDGALDLVSSESAGASAPSEGVTVWRGDGEGGFEAGRAYLAGSESVGVVAGRLSGLETGPGLAVLDARLSNVWTLLRGFGTIPVDFDHDVDFLPDVLEPILGLDALDADSDDDGLMDGIDPDTLRLAIASIPPSAARNPGAIQALDAALRRLDPLVRLRQARPVQLALAKQLTRYDGCSSGKQPDGSDWITACEAQQLLQSVHSTLAWNLSLHFSTPSPAPAQTHPIQNPSPGEGGREKEEVPPPRQDPPKPLPDRGRGEKGDEP